MARNMSDDNFASLENSVLNGEENLTKFTKEVEAFEAFVTKSEMPSIIEGLKEYPGIARSINADWKVISAARVAYAALKVKLEAELKVNEQKLQTAQKNRDHVPASASAKTGYVFEFNGADIPVTGQLTEDIKVWTRTFNGKVVEVNIRAAFSELISKQISEHLKQKWDGSKLVLFNDKKKYELWEDAEKGGITMVKVKV